MASEQFMDWAKWRARPLPLPMGTTPRQIPLPISRVPMLLTVPSPPQTTMHSTPSAIAASTILKDSPGELGKYHARSSAVCFQWTAKASCTRRKEKPAPAFLL